MTTKYGYEQHERDTGEVHSGPMDETIANTARRIGSGNADHAAMIVFKSGSETASAPDSAPPGLESGLFAVEFAEGSIPIHSR